MLRPYPWWSMSATRDPELRARLAGLTLRDEERLARRVRRGDDLEAEIVKAEERIARRRAAVPRITYPNLPVSERKDELLAAIRDNQVVVVAGETGSGKTTQLPKIALELGRGIRGGSPTPSRAGSPRARSRSGSPTSSTCRSARPSATPCASTTARPRIR